MKQVVNIARVLVGGLFVFSGLVKAIDPSGLAYKMQEFFEVWASEGYMKNMMLWLNEHALMFSIFMITLEVVLGIALLVGWRTKLISWLLLLLTLFFTFLTAYVLFSGKIRACGCFGDCIPLTPVQTFTKDIILLALVLLIISGRRYLKPLFSNAVNAVVVLISLLGVLALQWYVLKHLPVKDCLPFKVGNNILELRKTPKDATYDKFQYTYYYKKGNEEKDFEYGKQPDSTWIYVEGKLPNRKLVEKGNGKTALINDFILTTADGNDTTEAILSNPGEYYLLFIKDVTLLSKDWNKDQQFVAAATEKGKQVFIVSSERKNAEARYASLPVAGRRLNIPVLTGDVVALKTAARNNVTLYRMKGAVVQNKWGGDDIQKALK
ncbi:MAG TPA: BT_3928 family protein [Ferruginibacter sp.]|nr:BT_3928 family protein [Ferruginibacter sp.]